MYDGLLDSLYDCWRESRKLIIRRITAPDGMLGKSSLFFKREY